MKKALVVHILLLSTLLVAPTFASGTWEKTFGGRYDQEAYSVQQTSDGGYIIAGVNYSNSLGDVLLIKTDANGNNVWDRTFGGRSKNIGYSVQQTTDGGYIITGSTESYGAGWSDVWLIKTDATGNKLWDKTFGGSANDIGYSVRQTTDGGYIIGGTTQSYGAGSYDIWLIKTDASGNKLWDKTFGGVGQEIGYSVQQTNDGGYIIVGELIQSDYNFGLIKTDINGNELWKKGSSGKFVQQTTDGGYVIASKDWGLTKTNANGDRIWMSTDINCNSVQQTSDGGYIATNCDDYDIFTGRPGGEWSKLIKTDANGKKLWENSLGGYSVQQTSDGGYIIAGKKGNNAWSDWDVRLIKTDANGNM